MTTAPEPTPDSAAGHPSQAEGEDPDDVVENAGTDPKPAGHPSQAEGDDE